MQEIGAQAEFLTRSLCLFGAAYIAVQDVRQFRIPDHATFPLGLVGVVRAATLLPERLSEFLLAALLTGAVFWALAFVYKRLRGHEGLGLGDVKLAALIGLWLGMDTALAVLIGTGAALVVTLLLVGIGRRTMADQIPLGAYLALGLAVCLLWI